MELDLNVPDPGPVPGVVIENCVIVKAPVVMRPALIESLQLLQWYNPGMTQALELASGAMEIDVGALSLPFTEICKVTAQPVGMLAGRVKLI